MCKKYIILLLLSVAYSAYAQYQTPRQLYPGMFEQVQISQIFTDGKTFVDAIPKQNPQLIQREYLKHKTDANFNLKAFINNYFTVPAASNNLYKSNIKAGVVTHIDTLWDVLSRNSDANSHSSLIPLPHPYIVPGGRFREVYYWDSYFTMLGLQQSGKTQVINNIVENFAYLIHKLGHIPNGNRTYYISRSQPPFFCMMVELLAQDKGRSTLKKYLPEMLAEYNYWMQGASTLKPGQTAKHTVKLLDGSTLNRYWDASDQPREESYREDVQSLTGTRQQPPAFYRNIRAAAESGWDFSSRWFLDGKSLTQINTTDIIPVDLNALMYHMETVIASAYQIKGVKDSAQLFNSKAATRKQAITKYCWSPQQGWFMDYNFLYRKQTTVKSLAGTVPLFFGIATQAQADKVAQTIQFKFLKPGGLVTTLNQTGQQWDSPNAWAPLQYMAIEGLEKYNKHILARIIAERWIAINTSVFNQTGKLMEKYNVTDTRTKAGGGEYPLQDGFGWTNGVLLKLMNQYEVKGEKDKGERYKVR